MYVETVAFTEILIRDIVSHDQCKASHDKFFLQEPRILNCYTQLNTKLAILVRPSVLSSVQFIVYLYVSIV